MYHSYCPGLRQSIQDKTNLFFFLWAESDPCPLSESDEQDESLESLELEVEQLDESDATPVSSLTSMVSATAANSGSLP